MRRVGVGLLAQQCVQTSDNLNRDPAWLGGVSEYRHCLDEISDCFRCFRIPGIHTLQQSVLKMDELLLIASQHRRMERDNIADRRFDVQLPRYLLSLFVLHTRARTQHRWVTVPLRYCVDEPVDLAIELPEPQFEVSTLCIRTD